MENVVGRRSVSALVGAVMVGMALLFVVAQPAEAATPLSPGCTELNDPMFDGSYTSDSVIYSQFFAGEQMVFTAGPPDTVTNGASMTLWVDGAADQSSYPGTLSYIVQPSDAEYLGPRWDMRHFIGVPAETTWEVSCGIAPPSISGVITGNPGDDLSMARVDLFDGSGTYVDSFDGKYQGHYTTGALSAGDYYVLLYNGDDLNFFDYFAEWYSDTPLFLVDTPNIVTVGAVGVVGVDAVLDLFFTDMWSSIFLDDIIWLRNAGITRGCGNDKFCPDDTVTRGQMAAFLVRALGLTDNGGGDLFTDDDSSFFEEDIDRLATAGITNGCGPGLFCPDDTVTRGQMAAFLHRALGGVLYPLGQASVPGIDGQRQAVRHTGR